MRAFDLGLYWGEPAGRATEEPGASIEFQDFSNSKTQQTRPAPSVQLLNNVAYATSWSNEQRRFNRQSGQTTGQSLNSLLNPLAYRRTAWPFHGQRRPKLPEISSSPPMEQVGGFFVDRPAVAEKTMEEPLRGNMARTKDLRIGQRLGLLPVRCQ